MSLSIGLFHSLFRARLHKWTMLGFKILCPKMCSGRSGVYRFFRSFHSVSPEFEWVSKNHAISTRTHTHTRLHETAKRRKYILNNYKIIIHGCGMGSISGGVFNGNRFSPPNNHATPHTHTEEKNVWQCSKKKRGTHIQQPCHSHAIGLEIFGHRHRWTEQTMQKLEKFCEAKRRERNDDIIKQ